MDKILTRGSCVACANVADLVCQRCGDFYCSTQCQRKDWQSHRYICIQMPALVHPQSFSIYCEGIKAEVLAATLGAVSEAIQLPPLKANAADRVETKTESIKDPNPTHTQSEKSEDSKGAPNSNVSNNIVKKFIYSTTTNMPMPANKSIVYITGFRSPNRCFIRDASEKADEAYTKILETVNKLGKEMPRAFKPRTHQYVLSTYNGNLQRAKVLSTNNDNLRLLFVDQGVIKVRHATTIFEINDNIMSLPCYTIQVQLKGVPNYAIRDNIIKFLTQFENEKFVAIYANDNNGNNIELELFHAGTENSLNKRINEFCADKKVYDLIDPRNKMASSSSINEVAETKLDDGKAKDSEDKLSKTEDVTKVSLLPLADLQKSEISQNIHLEEIKSQNLVPVSSNDEAIKKETINKASEIKLAEPKLIQDANHSKKDSPSCNGIIKPKEEPLLVAPFETVCFKGNPKEGLKVFIVDNSNIKRGVFGALDSAHAREFSELQARLSQFSDPEPYEPVLKEFVIVKSDDTWLRAKVTQIEQPYYKVMFLEFINTEKVTMKDIRRYPNDLTAPCFTNMCFIEGIPNQLNQAQVDHLTKTFKLHSLVHIDSVTYLHNIAGVQCKKLIEELERLKD